MIELACGQLLSTFSSISFSNINALNPSFVMSQSVGITIQPALFFPLVWVWILALLICDLGHSVRQRVLRRGISRVQNVELTFLKIEIGVSHDECIFSSGCSSQTTSCSKFDIGRGTELELRSSRIASTVSSALGTSISTFIYESDVEDDVYCVFAFRRIASTKIQ